ncbi:hypothetical protein EPN15_00560 [Patescibacteria group bacterium]|nr:MAG: hypothetical protein EPN15_00560 [Patescibacteria group bacterium]
MNQLNLKPSDQIPEVKKRSINTLSVIVLAVFVFLIFGGLIYGASKISEFSENLDLRINRNNYQVIDHVVPNFYNANTNAKKGNVNTNRIDQANRNTNSSINNSSINHATNQAPINPPINIDNNCVDSDASLLSRDIYASGVVTLTSIGGQSVTTAYDRCKDNFTVEEVKCWEGTNGANTYNIQRIPYSCPKGCLNGACEE